MSRRALIVAIGVAVALGGPAGPAALAQTVTSAPAPPGAEGLGVTWLNDAAPDVGTMLVAVARPAGVGPFPAIVLLHGTHGFAHEYVRLARDLAGGGVVAIAACWFSGSAGAGARFVTPIGCPAGPPLVRGVSPEAMQRVDTLVRAVRSVPDARAERIALFGHSRGGVAVLNYVLRGGDMQAAVVNSGGYPAEFSHLAAQVKVPVLMLHGIADSPADGGGEGSNIRRAQEFEAALRAAGTPVETMYYEDGRHNGLFSDPAQRRDEVARIVSFLRRHLDR